MASDTIIPPGMCGEAGDAPIVPNQALEWEKLRLESERVRGELRLRERELEIRDKEARRNDTLFGRLGPVGMAALITALFALIGNAVVTYLQGESARRVEVQRSQVAVFVEAGKQSKTKAEFKAWINYFLQAGILLDPKGQLATLNAELVDLPGVFADHRFPPKAAVADLAPAATANTTEVPHEQHPLATGSKEYEVPDLIGSPIELYGVRLTVNDAGTPTATLSSHIRIIRPVCLPVGSGKERAVLLATAHYADGPPRTFEIRAFGQSSANRAEETSVPIPIGRAIPVSFSIAVQGRCS